MPKALVPGWLPDRVGALTDGGCDPVVVVLGAAAEQARPLVPPPALAVVAAGWRAGMGESLRAGLQRLEQEDVDAALVALVDTPGLTSAAVARLVRRAADRGPAGAVLAQAAYAGRPGHPVLLGRSHWAEVRAVATGDRGARDYLSGRTVDRVECGDVADGGDVDVPADGVAPPVVDRSTTPPPSVPPRCGPSHTRAARRSRGARRPS